MGFSGFTGAVAALFFGVGEAWELAGGCGFQRAVEFGLEGGGFVTPAGEFGLQGNAVVTRCYVCYGLGYGCYRNGFGGFGAEGEGSAGDMFGGDVAEGAGFDPWITGGDKGAQFRAFGGPVFPGSAVGAVFVHGTLDVR